jgi:chemotaxis protein methyltransferase CheR
MTAVIPSDARTGVLSDANFDRFREYYYVQTGISFGSSKRYFVDKRVEACVQESGEASFAAWFAKVRMGTRPDLIEHMVNRFTVNETYFLREDYQFDDMVRSVLPEIAADRSRNGRPIRILSMPCSTGEEPYSIALKLLTEWPLIDTLDVEIHGADIDSSVIQHARHGIYGERSLQRVPPALRKKFFDPVDSTHWQISDDVRSAVDFRNVNVCDSRQMLGLANFDVIFCRNMLIYFDELSSRRAAENLYGALRPGGYLFLGHSESMSRISPIFTPRRLPAGVVYQRPLSGATS